jgi:hypothetical protein
MRDKSGLSKSTTFLLLLIVVVSLTFSFSTFEVTASPSSSFYYRFTVDREGATTILINFQSDSSSSSWVIVPKDWGSTPNVISGTITQSSLVDTKEVVGESQYFYEAYKFTYKSSSTSGIFNMTIGFSMDTGALIIDQRGIFFSPLIGFDYPTSSGTAEVLFNSSLTVNSNNAIAIGSTTYQPRLVTAHRTVFNLNEKLLRLQIEFKTNLSTEYTTLQSVNKVFNFNAVKRYATYASSILNLYDRIYNNFTRLFNVTLTPPVGVQFFLPNFDEFLSIGGFTPFSTAGAGKININIFFIRAVNGTIEVIATHELAHHFLIKAGLSPTDFLWFHEGMAEYVSVTLVERLGYEGAVHEKNNLDQGASQLIQQLGEQNLGFVQNWNPSVSPTNVGNYYAVSYYVVSRLAQDYGGLDYYKHFFELIHGVKVDDIETLALYLSKAANADVALALQDWGFNVIDLYASPEIREKIVETQRAIAAVSPVFQPYKSLAEFFYKQALLSFKRGDTAGGSNLLQLAIIIADLAPLLTLLTIAAILGIIVYALHRRSEKAKLRSTVPPPPPEIFPKSAE